MFILDMSLKIANFKLQPHLPGGQEVKSVTTLFTCMGSSPENTEMQKIRCNEFKLKNIGYSLCWALNIKLRIKCIVI